MINITKGKKEKQQQYSANLNRISFVRVLSLLKEMLSPFRLFVSVLVVNAAVQTVLMGFRELSLKFTLDNLAEFNTSNMSAFSTAIMWICILLGTDALIEFSYRVYDRSNNKYKPLLKQHIVRTLMGKMFRYSYLFYQSKNHTELSASISNVFEGVEYSSILIFDEFIHFCLLTFITSLYALYVSTFFAFVLLSWGILWGISAIYWGSRMYILTYLYSQSRLKLEGKVADLLSHMLTVFSFNNVKHEEENVRQWTQDAVEAERRLRNMQFKIWVLQGIIFCIINASLMFYVLYLFKNGLVTIGDVSLVFGLITTLYIHLWDLAKNVREFIDAVGKISQGLHMLDDYVLDDKDNNREELKITQGEIVFDHIVFGYPKESTVDDDASHLFNGGDHITIKPGSCVGLVGPSGSGKSTLTKLLLRIFELSGGKILIDDQNISEVTIESLRQNIAIIPQDAGLLMHRSIAENIGYGTFDDVNSEQARDIIMDAAKQAQAHDFILQLPNGYDTVLSESGINLSGGQKQRIAIARGFARSAKIFILDEATSALDNVTQSSVQEFIAKVTKGKTTIIIAHRLDTLKHADEVLVFDKGRVAQRGKHSDLIKEDGLYKILWNHQGF